MNKQDFDEWLASIREAGQFLKEEQEASRQFTLNPLDVK